jgi:hypothetical protein
MSGMPPHFPGAPGWEEVADFAIDWAERHAGLTVAEHAAAKDPVSGDACGITRRTRRRCIRRFPSKSNTPDNLSRGPAREAYCPSPACTQTEQEGRIERVWRIALNVEFASPSARSSDSWPAHIRRPRRCADPRTSTRSLAPAGRRAPASGQASPEDAPDTMVASGGAVIGPSAAAALLCR